MRPRLPGEERTMAGIIATLAGMAEPFVSGPVKELFCCNGPANFEPEWSLYGGIIILALPTLVWRDAGQVSQLLFKYLWQRTVTRRQGLPLGQVPVFWFCDGRKIGSVRMTGGIRPKPAVPGLLLWP